MLNEEFAAASNWVAAMSQEDLRGIKRKHWTFVLHERNYECGELEFRKYVARKLSDFPLPALVSPLHDRDVKDNGEIVVPHVHVIVMFEQPQRYNTALAQLKYGCDFHTLNYLQPVANLRALERYLCHLDNPEKVPYSVHEVIEVAGAEYTIEKETASEICTNVIIDECIASFTEVMHRFAHQPSVKKWAISNVSAVRLLISENQQRIMDSDAPTEHILSDKSDETGQEGSSCYESSV